MLIDTHCHLNMIGKKKFDVLLTPHEITLLKPVVEEAGAWGVSKIINVGTSLVESRNSIALAERYESVYATVGLHPNDCTAQWKQDFTELARLASHEKVVGIGECGIDLHYEGYDLRRQQDAFKAQIELALEHNKALIVHSRDAYDETLRILDEYHRDITRAVIHCFSYDLPFAQQVIAWGFFIGIDGPITYPKNESLRHTVRTVNLENIVLETDAPFLPVQAMRGKPNEPKYIKTIAEYIAHLRNESFDTVARITTRNATHLFNL